MPDYHDPNSLYNKKWPPQAKNIPGLSNINLGGFDPKIVAGVVFIILSLLFLVFKGHSNSNSNNTPTSPSASASTISPASHASSLATITGSSYSVTFPKAWTTTPPPAPAGDILLLIKDPHPAGTFTPGLVLKKTPLDLNTLDQDVPSLIMANQLSHPDIKILNKAHVKIPGATDGVFVISEYTEGTTTERVLDILAIAANKNAYHLQSIAPATILTDSTINDMVNGFKIG